MEGGAEGGADGGVGAETAAGAAGACTLAGAEPLVLLVALPSALLNCRLRKVVMMCARKPSGGSTAQSSTECTVLTPRIRPAASASQRVADDVR